MAGLNSILSNTENTTLTLPKWYDTAQQGIVNASLTQAQAPSQAQNFATSTFAPGATNPFTSANSTLQTIGSGAANPWNVTTDASGKQTVTPNVSTPMGGLFSAQTDYLNKMMPDVVAPAEAQGVGAGGFGSSQARYGVEKARSGALSDLFQKQMAEALANQQTGVSAASAQGTVGGQGIKGALDTAAYPTANLSNLANVLNATKPGSVTAKQTDLAPLSQVGSLLSMIGGGSNIMDSIYGTPAVGTPGTPGYRPATQGIPALSGVLERMGLGRGITTTPAGGTTTTPTDTGTGTTGGPTTDISGDGVTIGEQVGSDAMGIPVYVDSSGAQVYGDGSSAAGSLFTGGSSDFSDPAAALDPWSSTFGEEP